MPSERWLYAGKWELLFRMRWAAPSSLEQCLKTHTEDCENETLNGLQQIQQLKRASRTHYTVLQTSTPAIKVTREAKNECSLVFPFQCSSAWSSKARLQAGRKKRSQALRGQHTSLGNGVLPRHLQPPMFQLWTLPAALPASAGFWCGPGRRSPGSFDWWLETDGRVEVGREERMWRLPTEPPAHSKPSPSPETPLP